MRVGLLCNGSHTTSEFLDARVGAFAPTHHGEAKETAAEEGQSRWLGDRLYIHQKETN
jgi:hypothetical protein